jgi:hypothetical protein
MTITNTRTNFKTLPEFFFRYAYMTYGKDAHRVIEERYIGGRNLADARRNLLNSLYRKPEEVHFFAAVAC